jgi:hypothetical protein
VLVLSPARQGKLHDQRFEAEEAIAEQSPDAIPIEVDLGFQGLASEYVNLRIPQKKPRGGELSEAQKLEHRALGQSRVVCENALAGVKRYGAVSQIYRNRIEDVDDHLMLTAAGLWNFYLMAASSGGRKGRSSKFYFQPHLFPNSSILRACDKFKSRK